MMINIQLTLNHESKSNLILFINQINMGFLKLFGRVLIITALVSSAYHHLQNPTTAVEEFKTNYKVIDQLSNQYLSFDIPYDNTNWVMGVRIFGLFEALVSCLIVFGDPLGGFLYLVSIFFQIFFLIWPRLATGTLAKWNFGQLQELSHFVALMGIGMVLICGGCAKGKQDCGKSCGK